MKLFRPYCFVMHFDPVDDLENNILSSSFIHKAVISADKMHTRRDHLTTKARRGFTFEMPATIWFIFFPYVRLLFMHLLLLPSCV